MYDDYDTKKTFSKIKFNHFQKTNYCFIKSLYWTVFNIYKYKEKQWNGQIVSGIRIRNSFTHIRSITIEQKMFFSLTWILECLICLTFPPSNVVRREKIISEYDFFSLSPLRISAGLKGLIVEILIYVHKNR